MSWIAVILLGFLLGSVPSGLLVGRLRGVDLRGLGSRNIGATNAFRVLGARWGILVFALDVAKGLVAVLAPRALGPAPDAAGGILGLSLAGGVASILGHIFSPWVRFRGGRGVATSLGVFLGVVPAPTILAFAIWTVLVGATRRVSVGSIGAALAYPFLVAALASGPAGAPPTIAASALVGLLVIVRHIPNIRRLLAGKEPPVFGKQGGDAP